MRASCFMASYSVFGLMGDGKEVDLIILDCRKKWQNLIKPKQTSNSRDEKKMEPNFNFCDLNNFIVMKFDFD